VRLLIVGRGIRITTVKTQLLIQGLQFVCFVCITGTTKARSNFA
jgi:hypothetical protein